MASKTQEQLRMERIAQHSFVFGGLKKFMADARPLISATPTVQKPLQKRVARKKEPLLKAAKRRSARVIGQPAPRVEIDERDRLIGRPTSSTDDMSASDSDELVDVVWAYNGRATQASDAPPTEEALQAMQEARCAGNGARGRGSIYHNKGQTCHFCRQKKLCGEENCPRCTVLDESKECIGKTCCARCMSATGVFCRACVVIRYGQTLEEARTQMDDGTWLCPHCYEEEHPDEDWICNSSICMKKHGLKPTGIAIYEAEQRGFKSVAHLVQANLKAKRGVSAAQEAPAVAAAAQEALSPVAAPAEEEVKAVEDMNLATRVRLARNKSKAPATAAKAAAKPQGPSKPAPAATEAAAPIRRSSRRA